MNHVSFVYTAEDGGLGFGEYVWDGLIKSTADLESIKQNIKKQSQLHNANIAIISWQPFDE